MSGGTKAAFAALALCALTGIGGAIVVATRPAWLREWLAAGARDHDHDHGHGHDHSIDPGKRCGHGVPEAFCTIDHPELKKTLLLCAEHNDIPEDICTLCHPEMEDRHKIEMCANGHKLPRHYCYLCDGGAGSASGSAPSTWLDAGGGPRDPGNPADDGWCAPHGWPEPLCGDCVEVGEGTFARRAECLEPLPLVRLASAEVARRAGLSEAEARGEVRARVSRGIAETAYAEDGRATVRARVSGFARGFGVDLGSEVSAGDVLATLDAPEVGAAKARWLAARAALEPARLAHERARGLGATGAVAGRVEIEALGALRVAEANLLDAEARLRHLGFGNGDLEALAASRDVSNEYAVRSPIAGRVVGRSVSAGEAVNPDSALFEVADVSRLWVWIRAPGEDADRIRLGQRVRFEASRSHRELAFGGSERERERERERGSAKGGAGEVFGTVTWIDSALDRSSRTLRVRAELDAGAATAAGLAANVAGRATIETEAPRPVVLAPRSALQRHEGTDLVFVALGEGRYRAQRVLRGGGGDSGSDSGGDLVEIAWGLRPGDRVVARGAYLLKTEIRRDSIGAGCCE